MSAALQPGSSLSHYRIVSRLGAGGMGEVYLARDETLERSVALKIIPPELVASEERVRRFVQEAKSASALNHPNIVTIHEIGQAEVTSPGAEAAAAPIHFIAMELVTGHTLRHLIHEERTDLRTLLGWLAQAADGLARAHASGIVHRDIKPENIMVSKDGFAKVLDFGLAKLVERREAASDATGLPTVPRQSTGDGALLGTISYMSPEQVQGRPVDHRSDVFAFGCVLYEATTRQRAFSAETDVETLHRILKDKPAPIEELNPQAPAVLRRLIRRCLAKNPEQRLQSMKDLAIELGEIVEEFETLSASESSGSGASAATAAPGRRVTPLAWAGITAGLLLVAAVVGIATRGLWSRGAPARAPGQRLSMTRLTSDGSTTLALSPDGRYLAHVFQAKEGYGLSVLQIAAGSDVPLVPPGPESYVGVAFSPDGEYVYFVRNEPTGSAMTYASLHRIPMLGGKARKLVFDVDSRPAFAPDGRRFAFRRQATREGIGRLMVAQADGTGERVLAEFHERRNEFIWGSTGLAWSPDGRRIAVRVAQGQSVGRIETVDVSSGTRQQVGEPWISISDLAWLPDGKGLVVTGLRELRSGVYNQLWLVPYPRGEATRITNDLLGYDVLSLAADGSALATVQSKGVSDLWVVPGGDPGRARALTSATGPEDSPASVTAGPAGSVFYVRGERGVQRLFSQSADGGAAQAVPLDDSLWVWFPRHASADGSIAFMASRDVRAWHVWRANSDGSDARQITWDESWLVDVSPDGQWIYGGVVGERGLRRMPARGGPATPIGDSTWVGGPLVSPDGRLIAIGRMIRERDRERTVAEILPAGGGPATWSRAWEDEPYRWPVEWTPDGKGLSFARNVGTVGNIWVQPLDQGPPRQVTRFDDLTIESHAWSRDGRSLYVIRRRTTNDAVLIKDFH